MTPETTKRVPLHTTSDVNTGIREQTERNVVHYGSKGPQAIDQRLQELDREWDIERVLEANAAAIALTGLTLGAAVHRRWFVLPAVVTAFLLQHAVQGWCPPLPVFRRLGIRTSSEIETERYALKALRGDFQDVSQRSGDLDEGMVSRLMNAIER